MAYAAIDCASKLTSDTAKSLKAQGITHVIRYLNPGWKGLTADEVKVICDSGLEIISVFESNPTQVSYFTQEQGKQDAQDASKYAQSLGQADGSIYFTVDYDCQGKDLGAVLDYFSGVVGNTTYKVGAYGSYAVLQYLKQHSKVDYFYQTIAWSYGQVCDFANLYQYEENVMLAGVNVDRDKVNGDIGSWTLPKPVSKPSVEAHGTYNIQSGDTFWDLEEKHGWQHGTLAVLNPNINARSLKVGQVINIPESISSKEYHIVKDGENLSVIASDNGLSLSEIEALNPQLKGHYDLIQPGEKVRVK